MTDQHDLDALSERVARKLGWSVPNAPGRAYWRSPDHVLWRLPAYASDWTLLPEMLAWLRERQEGVVQMRTQAMGSLVMHRSSLLLSGGGREWLVRNGGSFPEAVARLVVAVAEREAKEQP